MNLPSTQKTVAYEKFLGGAKLTELSKEMDIPYSALTKWSSEEGWMAKRDALEQEAFAIIEKDYQNFVLSNRKNVAQRHMLYATQLEDKIAYLFRKDPNGKYLLYHSPAQLKDLATALKAATDISARVVGIDKPAAANVNIKIAPVIVTGINARPRQVAKIAEPASCSPKSESSSPVLEAEFEEVVSLPPF